MVTFSGAGPVRLLCVNPSRSVQGDPMLQIRRPAGCGVIPEPAAIQFAPRDSTP